MNTIKPIVGQPTITVTARGDVTVVTGNITVTHSYMSYGEASIELVRAQLSQGSLNDCLRESSLVSF